MKTRVVWKDKMSFEVQLDGFKITMDADEKFGGQGKGVKPKGLTLVSLAGCTGMDVVSILKKMRVEFDSFEIETNAVLASEHPKKFDRIELVYKFTGENLPYSKIEKAVTLSQENYCGVAATLKPSVKLSQKILLN
jgi:putative redox protein